MAVLWQIRDGLNLYIFLLYSLSHKMPIRPVLSAIKRDKRLHMALGQSPLSEGLHTADSWTDTTSPWRLQMGLHRNRHSLCTELSLPDGKSNVQSTIEGPEPKILHQFALASHISSEQGTHKV